jgi:PAS domain S-box-containing protein
MSEKPTYEDLEQRIRELEKTESERKQAEAALHHKAALLEAQVASSSDGILVVDPQGKKILQNQRTVELWKIPQHIADNNDDEMQVQHVMHMTKNPEPFVEKVAHLYKHPDESSRDEVELKDGTVFDRYSAPVVGKDGQNLGRIWTFRDITDRKRAEISLKESEAFIRAVLENLPIGIAVNSVNPDVKFEYMNDNFPKYYRTTRETLADPDAFWNAVYEEPEFRDKIKKRILDDCASGDPERMYWKDVPITRKGDETTFITARNIPIPDKQLMISTVWDITERKQSEAALQESEEKFRSFSEQSLVGIYLIQDGVFKYVNPKFADIFGYTVDECLKNMHFRKLVHPDDLALVERQVQSRVVGKIPSVQYGFRGIKKNGEVIHVEIYGSSILYRGRTAVTGTMLDVTDRNRLQAQLEQAQKMESIGTLAGGIAHDFNNILSPIMIHSEMAMMELPSGSPLQQNMKQIYKAGQRAGDLVKQILTFARKQGRELIPLSVSRILKETIKLLRSSIPTTIDIQYDIKSEQGTVLSDPTQLNQIIMNLCTNAAHAMEENGGTLEVILTNENIASGSADSFPDLKPGRYAKLTVRDTGQGIEPQFMDKIFEPYFTTKEVGKGTGMGLALVHGIVKSYGGVITVQSEMGKGTSFHVYLPLVEEEADILETAQDSVQLPTGTERILFVDDEKAAADVMQLMLEKLGFKVTAQTSSIEALEVFRNKPQEFDLVITDQTMPNMTGKDLAKELMVIRPDIPIILCTGFSEKIDERRAGEMGINAFVMKPIVMGKIANTIRVVLDGK